MPKKKTTKKPGVIKKAVQQIKAVSYSRYSTWVKCPFQAKCKYILKLPDPSGPAAERGNVIHKNAEDYVKGKIKTLCKELLPFKKEIDGVKKAKIHSAEEEWAFNKLWQPVGWFDRDVYLRIKMDATKIIKDAFILDDYKTGKIYPDHSSQMELYSAGGVARVKLLFPKVKKIITRLLYIDQREISEEEFDLEAAEHQIREWDHKFRPMLADRTFPAKPGYYCRYCPFRKSKGGPCKHDA